MVNVVEELANERVNDDLAHFVSMLFAKNMLQLYKIDGTVRYLNHQRHICNYGDLKKIPGKNKKERLVNSVFAALCLCEVWRIHLVNSEYSLPWYICVQVERSWWKNTRGMGTPPYVVLATTRKDVQAVRDYELFHETSDIVEPCIQEAINNFSVSTRYGLKKDTKHDIWRIIPEQAGIII